MNPTTQTLLSAYRTFVETNGRLPRTLTQLAEIATIPVSSLRETFPSVHEITQYLWEDLTVVAIDAISITPEFSQFIHTEQVVSLFMEFLDACEHDRELTLLTFKPDPLRPVTRGIPLLDGTRGIRRGLHRTLPAILAQSDQLPSRGATLVDDRIVTEAITGALLSALAFWITDTSTGKAHTEAYVDHLAAVIGSALESRVGNSLVELASFLVKAKGVPLLSTVLATNIFSKKMPDEQ